MWGSSSMTDIEFQVLMGLKKVFAIDGCRLPNNGENATYDLISPGSNEKFLFDIDRKGKIELSKFKLQNRYGQTKLPLVRVDIDSPPHMNPDGTIVSRNHIHIFKEMDSDTGNLPWAYDLETFEKIKYDRKNIRFMDVFFAFCEYCNIDVENVQGVM